MRSQCRGSSRSIKLKSGRSLHLPRLCPSYTAGSSGTERLLFTPYKTSDSGAISVTSGTVLRRSRTWSVTHRKFCSLLWCEQERTSDHSGSEYVGPIDPEVNIQKWRLLFKSTKPSRPPGFPRVYTQTTLRAYTHAYSKPVWFRVGRQNLRDGPLGK